MALIAYPSWANLSRPLNSSHGATCIAGRPTAYSGRLWFAHAMSPCASMLAMARIFDGLMRDRRYCLGLLAVICLAQSSGISRINGTP